ncbi:LemA family protein [Haploplasma axanthum]|uniref:LemA family n=1 Tax=Haploplasma axanthum TaxID=29552 RepID=A0A449BDK6_HAPAX|nr:LemA family protein [Haploplasma axanthum]VEU80512.1 LemA family [Haploplasma axanthum]
MFLADTGQVLLIVGVIIVLLVLIVVFWAISVSNTIKRMKVKVEESESGIDVALTQRFDMLNKLFQATKGFMKHEKETLEGIVKLRQPAAGASIEDKQNFSNQVERGLQAINVVVEQYPNLKSSETVTKLQNATINVEENLQAARRIYNSNVSHYNRYIVVFPNSIIANRGGATKLQFFEAEDIKRQDVKFDF